MSMYKWPGCSQEDHLPLCMHFGRAGTYLSHHLPVCEAKNKNTSGPCICRRFDIVFLGHIHYTLAKEQAGLVDPVKWMQDRIAGGEPDTCSILLAIAEKWTKARLVWRKTLMLKDIEELVTINESPARSVQSNTETTTGRVS
jgi:hypothetical protein